MTELTKTESFDQWAVVELMGHQQIVGRVTEQKIGDGVFIRVDVAEQPVRFSQHTYDKDEPAIPAFTRYLGSSAIYAINPCSEEAAKATASRMRVRPPIIYGAQTLALTATSGDDNEAQLPF